MYDEKKMGFNFFCVLSFTLLVSLAFVSNFLVCMFYFLVYCFLWGLCYVWIYFLSLFLIRMSALESLYAKCPIGFPIEWRG